MPGLVPPGTPTTHLADVFPFPKGAPGVAPIDKWTLDQGVDIAAPGGTPELAVVPGIVTYRALSGFGDHVAILHGDNGVNYYYGHADPQGEVAPNTHVKAGQEIATVGQGIVGKSTGPHLEIGLATPSGLPTGLDQAQLRTALSLAKSGAQLNIIPNPANIPGDIAKGVVGLLSDWFGATFVKAALYVVLAGGGAALIVMGVSRTFGLHPHLPKVLPVPV